MSLRPLVTALAVCSAAAPALAATLRVPQDHATIGAAVAAAQPGDTVLVSAGTYTEAVTIDGIDDLTLRGKGDVTIDATGSAIGIRIQNCARTRLSGLRLVGPTTGVFLDQVEATRIERCEVASTSSAGILIVAAADVSISRSAVHDTGGDGISIVGGTSSLRTQLSRVDVRDVGGNAIYSLGQGDVVSRCVLEDCGVSGAALQGDDATLDRVRVARTFRPGIQLFAARGVASRCVVEDPRESGIQTFGADSPIVRCRVLRAGSVGIRTYGVGSPVQRCRVEGSAATGIQVFEDDSPIERCSVSAAGQAGIQSFGDRADVLNCRVDGAADHGIDLYSDASAAEGCRVQDAQTIGILADGDANAVTRNVVLRPGADGIVLTGTNARVESNKVKDAGGSGIVATTGSHTLDRNTARGSAGLDADDQVPGENTWTRNRFGTDNIP